MFGSIDKSKGLLFCTHDLSQSLRNTVAAMYKEVESLAANRLLNTAPDDLRDYLAAKYRVESIRLLRDQWYADTRETQVDVRYDTNRWIDDKSRPFMVPDERVEVRVTVLPPPLSKRQCGILAVERCYKTNFCHAYISNI